MNYGQAVDFLMNIPKFTHEPGLEPAKMLLKLLGNPEKNKKIIHVAGTNGKGSVCAYMNSVLTKAGINTGLFTSPHLVRIEERIRINGRMVSEELFAEAFEVVFKFAEELEADCPTYVALRAGDMMQAKRLLNSRYHKVTEENDYLRVYDEVAPEEISYYLFENSVTVSELKTDKISLEEYYTELMAGGRN